MLIDRHVKALLHPPILLLEGVAGSQVAQEGTCSFKQLMITRNYEAKSITINIYRGTKDAEFLEI